MAFISSPSKGSHKVINALIRNIFRDQYLCTYYCLATNACLKNNCSHICLLSATHPQGYTCACPSGLELDGNLRDCKGTLAKLLLKHECNNYLFVNSAQLGLLFALQSLYIQRIDLDGSNSVTLHSGGNPVAVDYDYRLVRYSNSGYFKCMHTNLLSLAVLYALLSLLSCLAVYCDQYNLNENVNILQEQLPILVRQQLSKDLESTF